MSEWLLFNANSAIFQLYRGEKKWIFNDMMMRSALYKTNTLSWTFKVPAHWNNSPWLDMSPHSDTLSWSEQTSRCSFSLMLCAYLRNYKYQFDSLWFDPIGVEPAIFHTRGDHANNRGFNSIYADIFKITNAQQLLVWLPHVTLHCRWWIDSECDALQRPTCFSLSRLKWRVWHSPYSRHYIASRPKGSWL